MDTSQQSDDKDAANTAGSAPVPSAAGGASAKTDTEQVVIAGAHSSDALKVGDLTPRQKPRGSFLEAVAAPFLPNRAVSGLTMGLIIAGQVAVALLVWVFSPFKVLPQPMEVWSALQNLWLTQGLGQNLMTSFTLNLEALAWSTLIALLLSYLTVLPVFRPITTAISKGRFLSLAGFTLVFTLIWGGGHPLKTSLLTFGITVFYVTSMASVIAAIPRGEFDHARTLRMSEWRVVWEVVVLGTVDKVFEVLRQNAAIGWMMLAMVEIIAQSEGGLGAMLEHYRRHTLLPEVFAIQITILLVGLFQDYAIGAIRRLLCPYADLTLERK